MTTEQNLTEQQIEAIKRSCLWVPVNKVNHSTRIRIAPHPFYVDDAIRMIFCFSDYELANEWGALHEINQDTVLASFRWDQLIIFEAMFDFYKEGDLIAWGDHKLELNVDLASEKPTGVFIDDLHFFPISRENDVSFSYERFPGELLVINSHDLCDGKEAILAFSREFLLYIYLCKKGIEYDRRKVINNKYSNLLDAPEDRAILLDLDPTLEIDEFTPGALL